MCKDSYVDDDDDDDDDDDGDDDDDDNDDDDDDDNDDETKYRSNSHFSLTFDLESSYGILHVIRGDNGHVFAGVIHVNFSDRQRVQVAHRCHHVFGAAEQKEIQ